MPVDWRQTKRGTLQAHVARVGDCHLSVIGAGDAWHWFVRCREHDRFEGSERTLVTAMTAAEAAARRLADEGE
jgi:hypothetical protein